MDAVSEETSTKDSIIFDSENWPLLALALAVSLVHVLTNNRYGFHRDELQVLSDARHMDWGFVTYPPFTPFVERMGLGMFGLSLVGLRLFSVLAQAVAIVVAGLCARELNGGRLAQFTAALAVALSPLPLFNGTEFQYTSFDFLWWVLTGYFLIRLLSSENPRWWLGVGATVGMGMLTKYSMAFLVCGIAGGILLSGAWRYLTSRWFWAGTTIAVLLFLPNLVWQIRHDFISLTFLQHIHARDVRQGRSDGFLTDQFWLCTNSFAVPLWVAGLLYSLYEKRYRMLGWTYLITLGLFIAGKGRGYYLAGAYPMLIAMGAVLGERWVESLSRLPRRAIEAAWFIGLAGVGAYVCALIIPFAGSGPLKDFALRNNGDLREEIGWDELVKTVADIRNSLPADQRQHLGIVVGNYGEQGAVEMLGPAYQLPTPISGTNSAWLRGYPEPPPATLIVLGLSRNYVDRVFTGCRVAGHNGNRSGVHNEESDEQPDIYVCGGPRSSWPDFWKQYQHFG